MTNEDLRHRLIVRIQHLAPERLVLLEQLLAQLGGTDAAVPSESSQVHQTNDSHRDWPRAPLHRLSEHGTFFVTAGTLYKSHHFSTCGRLDLLEAKLLELAGQYGWHLEAWAVFSNHYHFVGHSQATSAPLNDFLGNLHSSTAKAVNELDSAFGRQVWYNFWETRLTYERSYLARLNYVHQNPVRHGLVRVANQYCWCSAAWFERTATTAQVKTLYRFKIDQLRVIDDFEVLAPGEEAR
jgi:putative transposase